MIREFFTPQHAAAMLLCLALPASALAAEPDPEARLAETVERLETDLGARIGVLVRDSGSEWQWGHRAEERFLMASTFKSVLCGAVLAEVDAGRITLEDTLDVRAQDMVDYAPVTERHVGGTMSVDALCYATLDMSDNPAANILIGRLGGPAEVTAFLRGIGDAVTRLDRLEPDLNIFAPGDPRDTSTPAAMVSTWQTLLLGDALTPQSRQTLARWMSDGGVTGALIRAETPAGWTVADKSGSGQGYTRNLVAMITPPDRDPYLVAIFVSDTPADFAARNAALSEVGAAVVGVIEAR